MNRHIIVAGCVCLDITPAFENTGCGARVEDLFRPGKLVSVGRAHISTGGAVSNTGLGLKVLGADVSLMGKIGCDAFGDLVIAGLGKYAPVDGMIRSAEQSTSYSVVLAIPGIDRIFMHDPGANDSFCADDVPESALREAALLHFGYPPVMRAMYAQEGEELVRLLRKAKGCGCAVSLDMAAIGADTDAGKADWRKILGRALPYVDFFVPSVEELCCMLDPQRLEGWQKRARGGDVTEILTVEDIKPLGDKCVELGAKAVLLKCGALGMYLKTAPKARLSGLGRDIELRAEQWSELELFEPSYIPDLILSGTGAGDTSIAAFLLSVINAETPQMALHLAAVTGASCLGAYDALGGLRPLPELRKRIEAGWPKRPAPL